MNVILVSNRLKAAKTLHITPALVLAMMAGFLDALWIGAAQALIARGSLQADPKAPRNFI